MSDISQNTELSVKEAQLIHKYKNFYLNLQSGRRKPETEAQKHFIEVTLGLKSATNIHEVAFVKYMRKVANLRKEERKYKKEINPEDGATEGWYTRDDYKKYHS